MKRLLIHTTALFTLLFATSCTSTDQKPSTNKNNSTSISGGQEIKFALSDTITTLDPRKTRGMASTGIVQLLFEGLTRVDDHGNILPGAAEGIHISPDMKTYTFSLREGKWSNGDHVKASDFEYSWKSQLNPEMKASTNYLLFTIKSAEAALNGKCPLDQVGIKAPDDKTLIVTLENPTPYFLQLAATPTYFPVNQKWIEEHSESSEEQNFAQVSNGPFYLDSWTPHQTIQLKKNNSYFSANTVKVDKLHFSIIDSRMATTMFKESNLDWIGSPFSNIGKEIFSSFQIENKLKMAPAAGTFFLRANIEKGPFNNQKIRHAFNLAIDKQAIINEAMKEEGIVATSFVPPSLGLPNSQYGTPSEPQKANQLFEEALSEMNLTRETLAPINFCFISSDTTKKIAQILQKNWKEAFNVEIILDEADSSSFYEKVFLKDYTLATGSWFAEYFDPMSFLSVFQYKENGTNNTEWSNNEYTRLLEASCLEVNPPKRTMLLQQAQDILMNELPIMPILHFSFVFANDEKLQNAELSPLGTMSLNKAIVQ